MLKYIIPINIVDADTVSPEQNLYFIMVKLLKTTMVKYLHINEALNTESSFFRLKFSKFSATQTRMNTHF